MRHPQNVVIIATVFIACVSGIFAAQNSISADSDIDKLLTAANKRDRAWEWRGPVPEVELVARHGKSAASKLIKLLEHPNAISFDDHIVVDQQIQLVLCRLFDEKPEHGRTIYLVRALEKENAKVREFWINRVNQYLREGR